MRRIAEVLRYFAKAGSWSVMDQALFAGANAVLNVALARALGPHDFGAYSVAFSIYLLAFPVHGAFLVEPMLVLGAGAYRASWPRYLSIVLRGHWAVSLGVATVLAAAGATMRAIRSDVLADTLLVLAIAAPFLLFQVLLRRACYAVHRPRLAALSSAAYFVLLMAGLAAVHVREALTPTSALLLMACASLGSVAWLAPALKAARLRPGWSEHGREILARHVRYGRWAVGYRFLQWIPGNYAFLVLPLFGSLGATGTLRAVRVLFMPLAQATSAFGAVIVPSLAGTRHGGRFREKASALLVAIVGGGIVYVLAIGLAGNRLLDLLYGDQYAGYAWLVWILGAGTALGVVREILSSIMRALERPDRVFVAYLAPTVAFVVLSTLLIANYGLAGAAWAMILPPALQTGVLGWMLVNDLRVRTDPVSPSPEIVGENPRG